MLIDILVFQLRLTSTCKLLGIIQNRMFYSEILGITIRRGRLGPVSLSILLSSSLGRSADRGKVDKWEIRDWMEDKPVITSRADKHDNIRVRVLNPGSVLRLGEFSKPVVLGFNGIESLLELPGHI